ncbi:BRCA2, oligonucleotide/oligosaccharide-binding, domain 1-domain-containing protein, partial [Mrakia frigida]|uniref:BRCA2, oligonucleotide/oligosaccharide-binding, domain 1-domain-containing protein n=1 Tax=Mrakia frigida TaxID=29902 RepID=UPI003FCC0A68
MLKQLKYRYEREHNQGHRSAIQRIQEQDSPASLSMVLCVSSIQWLKAPVPDVGARDAPPAGTMLAAMELTDGWYRIKATSDTVLSSAVTRGKLRVGCKIGLSGVRLDAKEGGTPVLKALDSSSLTLTANTTSLLPWDTKLGFHPRPFIACLSSLSAEGGLVPVMDIVVEKCFPLAFVDGYDAKPGDTAPRPVQISRSEADEMKEVEKWERTNNLERRKIHSEIEKKMEAFLTLTERVERAAGRAKSENSAADSSEDIYWDLDDAEDKTAFLKNLDASVLPGLARFMKQKYIEDGNTMQQQIEDEISNRCPPRNVRSMRVVRIRDFKTSKPAIRTAQLTFWDAADQGEDGGLVEGKRYLVTNLMPSQRGSWAMGGQSGEIYLSSRRDSKWQQM